MIEQVEPHQCQYRTCLKWDIAVTSGELRERVARRAVVCKDCGRERSARRPQPPVLVETEVIQQAGHHQHQQAVQQFPPDWVHLLVLDDGVAKLKYQKSKPKRKDRNLAFQL